MEDFKIIYRILRVLYMAMECEIFDEQSLSPEALKTSLEKRDALLRMLVKNGYVEGITLAPVLGQKPLVKLSDHPQITLPGLEYLEENSLMQKAANAMKGLADVVL